MFRLPTGGSHCVWGWHSHSRLCLCPGHVQRAMRLRYVVVLADTVPGISDRFPASRFGSHFFFFFCFFRFFIYLSDPSLDGSERYEASAAL